MKNQYPYAKLLPCTFLFLLLSSTYALFAQTQYEGFGAGAIGGSNSTTVYHVTNLNSSGAGSLAAGIGSNKTIVFDVSGTIVGRFDLINISYLTIDATGRDITIDNNGNGDAISFDGSGTHHCILKGVHVTDAGNDGINVLDGAHDIVITNCTSYGNRDGNIDIANDSYNVTVQYCILGGGASGWSGAMLITSTNVSVHHNLYLPATSGQVGERNPLVHSNYSSVGSPNADFRNNVVYKWGRNGGTGSGYGTAVCYNATANVINNYYYSLASADAAVNTDDGYGSGATGKVYASGNFSGNTGVNPNGASNHAIYPIPTAAAVTTQDACTAAALVLANAGPSPRNAVDISFINSVSLIGCSTGNVPPVANAGNDITITLPTTSTTLNGSATDADGTIASYSWSRVSGPTTFTLANATSAVTALTGLVQGTYVFRLTVTDNGGATDTDDVTVIVNPLPNLAPTANAGTDITLTLPVNATTLTGSGADPDGTISAYAWTRVSGPTTFTLGTPNAASTTLTNLVQGTYVFRLRVTDNGGATGTDDITVIVNPAPNQAPSANAGTNITLTLPTNSTTLNGSGTDPDGTISSYAWTRVSGPNNPSFGTPGAATTTVTGLIQGTYVFRLTVTDNSGATGTDDLTVTVNAAPNQAPTANAGGNIVLTLPASSTTLNGSGTDPDGTISSYAWTRVSGPNNPTLGTPNAASTTVAGLIQGTYVFRLTVTDNSGATATDDVNVTVNASTSTNQAPIANAGVNTAISLPANSVTLNGSGSIDLDGTITSYAWSYVSGPASYTITNAGAASTTVTGLVQGTYIFRLTVTDNGGATDADNVAVMVNAAANQAPSANAGNNITLTLPVNSTTLSGNGSDIDGTISSYAWTRVSGPTTFTLGTPNAATTTLSNLVQGTYVFRLTVTDNGGATASDDVTVTVNPAPIPNQPPVARAGTDIVMTLPTNSTTLNGNTSTDADGTIVSYAWSRVSGPTTYTFTSAGSAATGVNNLVQGTYIFRLTVTDDDGATSTDDITVTVNAAANQAPVANAGPDRTITLPVNSTTLTGSGTDPDGIITGYAWARVSGPTTFTLGNASAASTSLTNLVQGTYIFRLTVTDNSGATGTDNVTVVVNAANAPANQPPVANAGPDRTITLPVNSTTLAGSGSDPDGTVVAYAWTRVSGPATFLIANGSAASASLTNLVQGTYIFRLTVTDNYGAADTDDVTVIVNAAPPGANQPPVARTTVDSITLTLPVNAASLNGTTSTDADGIIAAYEWTQVSGPNQATIGNGLTAIAQVSNLTIGLYVFQLRVTDDDGASATRTMKVAVKNKNGNGVYFNLYPNPTQGNLTLQYYANGNGKYRISIYDATRRLVKDGFADKNQVTLTETMDVSFLKNGVYFIQLVLPDGKTASKQFIKM